MLQAYFDDSTEQGEVLVFSGWIAPTETWVRFSKDWQAVLDGPPRRPVFKMGKNRSGAGLARAKRHYALTRKYNLVGIGCAIPICDLRKVVSDLGLDPHHTNPYLMAWRAVFTQCFMAMDAAGSRSPIEFIFDHQTEKVHIINSWDAFVESCPKDVTDYVKGAPDFQCDDGAAPLQAADLIAWWARRQYLVDKTRMGSMFPEEWTRDFGEPNLLFADMPEAALRLQFEKDSSRTTS